MPRPMWLFMRLSAVVPRASHRCALCAITPIINRIQLMRPNRGHSVGFLRSLLDQDLKTDTASIVSVIMKPGQPNSEICTRRVEINGPVPSSRSAKAARRRRPSKLRAAAKTSAEEL
eukprot:95678-Pyramimonas_sp.AAC.1